MATASPKPPSRLTRFLAGFDALYLRIDPRTAGLFRLVLGFLLIADGLRHWAHAEAYYSNAGVLTNHLHLKHPDGSYNFSLFHAFSSPAEVHVLYALGIACFAMLFVGYRSRLFAFLSFVFVTSMDNRIIMIENGGYVVVNLVVFWSVFLPIERRFSIDAWRKSLREHREQTIKEVNRRPWLHGIDQPVRSLASLLVILNFATIYFFNVVNKSGELWRSGDAVHYVLHLDRMVTGIAIPLREHLPRWALKPAAWSVLCVEALIIFLILSPTGRRITRPFAMVLIVGLHTTFGTFMRLGPFSWFMIGWSMLIVTPIQWAGLNAWHRRRMPTATLFVPRERAAGLFVARLVARLDMHRVIKLKRAPAADPQRFLFRVDDDETSGAAALRSALRHALGGRVPFGLVRLLSLGLVDLAVWAVTTRTDAVERFFGLSNDSSAAVSSDASPLRRRLIVGRTWAKEIFLALFATAAVSQVINENKSVPDVMKHEQPAWARALIRYPRLFQGWGMFSANPIQEDGSITVDAMTSDGRRIDPFTGGAPDMNLSDARGLGLGQIQQDYFNRIRHDANKRFRPDLERYLRAYHERTGRPEDELVAFDVYWLRDHCPEPGTLEPYDHEAVPIHSYRKPGYAPPAGVEPMPPAPPPRSARKRD